MKVCWIFNGCEKRSVINLVWVCKRGCWWTGLNENSGLITWLCSTMGYVGATCICIASNLWLLNRPALYTSTIVYA